MGLTPDRTDRDTAPDDLLALLRDIQPLESMPANTRGQTDANYVWIAVTTGSTDIRLSNGNCRRYAAGTSVVIGPGVGFSLSVVGGELPASAAGYVLHFELLRCDGQTEDTRLFRRYDSFIGEEVCMLTHPSWCTQTMQELLDEKPGLMAKRAFRTAPSFLQLFRMLCEEINGGTATPPAEAIERTLRYIERHYDKPVNRRQLAELANMSQGHYSTLFKKRTGLSPLEYVHQVRMNEAKKRLETAAAPLKSIAQSVGYSDEFYFSRKFKQLVGMPPVAFAKRKPNGRRRLASLSYAYTGHLSVLAASPIAFLEHAAERRHCPGALAIRTPGDEGWLSAMKLVADLEPELILADDQVLDRASMDDWSRIAPLRVLPWLTLNWRDHLRHIARLLDSEAEAESWLARYAGKAERAAEAIRRSIRDESVAVIRVHRQQVVAYGGRNIASVLYDDLRLSMPAELRHVSHTRRLLTSEDWEKCEADHILLMIDPDPVSLVAGEQVTASRVWKRLKAVRDNNVHSIRRNRWLEYSAASHEGILDEAVRLFTHSES